ncbi:MAG TPA: hypothetical protein VMZ91_02240 [Candidatus Paceibacterota bacterium]|nr:hypothetical protein [Candidatus Paceibacterota bacterium]
MTQTLEEQIKEKLQDIFNNYKCLPAGDFWKRMENYVKELGKTEIDGEVYRAVAELYQKGILGLDRGCYIYKTDGELFIGSKR